MSKIDIVPSTPQSTSSYMVLQSLREGLVSLDLPSKLSRSWKRFIRSSGQQPHATATTMDVTTSSRTITGEMPAVILNENLSAEDREARTKTLKLAARIGHLYETDEAFRRELLEAIDEIEAGHFVTFSENGWSEE